MSVSDKPKQTTVNERGASSTVTYTGLKTIERAALAVAVSLYALIIGAYILKYGTTLTDSHEKWGQFGDFVGGVLNPIYALLAFLAVLLTLSEQRKEQARAQAEFDEQKKQLNESSYKEDVYRIIKEIDEDIDRILEIKVGSIVTVYNMAHEAQRQRDITTKVSPYAEYMKFCKDETTDIGVYYARLVTLIEELKRYLTLYSGVAEDSPKPVAEYFARKHAGLMQMFRDIGGVSLDVISFFEAYH